MDGRYADVVPFLLLHLLLLHGADAFTGVKDHDVGAGNVFEAFKGSFPRIAAGCRQNEDLPFFLFLLFGSRQKVRKEGQGQVLKGQGPAVEQFSHGQVGIDGMKGHDAVVAESFFIVSRGDHSLSFIGRKVGEEMRQDDVGNLLIGLAAQFFIRKDIFGKGFGHVETAVGSQAVEQGVGWRNTFIRARTSKIHI